MSKKEKDELQTEAETATEKPEKTGKLSISTEDLAAIVSAAVSNAVEKSAEMFGQAMVEAKKPYVNPADEVNRQAHRESIKRQEERKRALEKASHEACPHLQGCHPLGSYAGTLTSIVWHRLDNNTLWGICTVCQRQFWPSDPDYVQWRRKPSANVQSEAGMRYATVLVPPAPQPA